MLEQVGTLKQVYYILCILSVGLSKFYTDNKIQYNQDHIRYFQRNKICLNKWNFCSPPALQYYLAEKGWNIW